MYQIYNYETGLDYALRGIMKDSYNELDKSIITLSNLTNNADKTSLMYENYKKFPKNIDVLLVSDEYLSTKSDNNLNDEEFSKDNIRDLLFHLLFSKGYDYVIIDLIGNANYSLTETLVELSSKAIFTISQDVNSIALSISKINQMYKKRINLDGKIYYILNKFCQKSKLSEKDIVEWLGERNECNLISIIDDYNREFIDSNYMGIPMLLNSPPKSLRQSLNKIKLEISK